MKRSEFLASLLCLPIIGLSKIKKPVEDTSWVEYVARCTEVSLVSVKDKRVTWGEKQPDGKMVWHPAVFHSYEYDKEQGFHYLEVRVIRPENCRKIHKSGIVRYGMWQEYVDRYHGYYKAWK